MIFLFRLFFVSCLIRCVNRFRRVTIFMLFVCRSWCLCSGCCVLHVHVVSVWFMLCVVVQHVCVRVVVVVEV